MSFRLGEFIWFVAACGMIACSSVAGYWAFIDSSVPLAMDSASLVTTAPIKAGDTFVVRRSYCVRDEVSVTLERYIIGRTVIQLPAAPLPMTPGCHILDFDVALPLRIAPDNYIYRTTAVFERNPLQPRAEMTFPDVPFTVTP